jgi:hypothetical protein
MDNTQNTTQVTKIIDLTPDKQVQENIRLYRPWFLLWLFTFNIRREIIVWYSISADNRLIVSFENNRGYRRFPNKEHAERWFGADIDISEHVGEEIISETRQTSPLIRCEKCGAVEISKDVDKKPKDITVLIKGPKSAVKKPIRTPSWPHSGACEKCGGNMCLTLIETI